MNVSGILQMLQAEYREPVRYWMRIGRVKVPVSAWLGKEIEIIFSGAMVCSSCGCAIEKSYGDGNCYDCFSTLPECARCVIKPELCRAHTVSNGNDSCIDRDRAWAAAHHNTEQLAYLAVSSGLKIGVTRPARFLQRWMNQGATRGIAFALGPNRYAIGRIEQAAKQFVADKTDWRKMLRGVSPDVDLLQEKRRLAARLALRTESIHIDDTVHHIQYPVMEYPRKVRSVRLDKTGRVGGVLSGVKGQYLMFRGGDVFNVRRHQGFVVEMNAAISNGD